MLQITDFNSLFTNNTALIDTRSPIEFKEGAFPHAKNLVLMNDKERELVGICYKNNGKDKAIELGHSFVQGDRKIQRMSKWLKFINNNPNGALYCFRGGMRSQIAQQWINEEFGINYPRIYGGYKALRRFLIDQTERIMINITPIVIGGQTGCGKTLLLNKLNNKIDLEGLANHRGSAFGNTTTPQPTQINFENSLAIELIKKQTQSSLVFEDESANIGTVHIPRCVQNQTNKAAFILLETDIEQRLKISINAYVIDMHQNFIIQNNAFGFDNFSNYWKYGLEKIQKRLGLVHYKTLLKMLNKALLYYKEQGDPSKFYPVLEVLLLKYYDPMYRYQIQKKQNRIVFKGNANEVLAYLCDTFKKTQG